MSGPKALLPQVVCILGVVLVRAVEKLTQLFYVRKARHDLTLYKKRSSQIEWRRPVQLASSLGRGSIQTVRARSSDMHKSKRRPICQLFANGLERTSTTSAPGSPAVCSRVCCVSCCTASQALTSLTQGKLRIGLERTSEQLADAGGARVPDLCQSGKQENGVPYFPQKCQTQTKQHAIHHMV